MKTIFRTLVAFILLAFVAACSQNSSLLNELSGVWRAKGDGTMVSIIYADKKMRLLFGDDAIPVSLGEIDNANKTVNMNVTLRNGKPGVWTVRQIWDKEKTSFNLQLTLHDGTQDDLAFVRKISVDDLNKVANAEARNMPGSIGNVAKAAEAPVPVSIPAQAVTPVAVASPAAMPAVEAPAQAAPTPAPAPAPAPAAPVAITWAPSFDCNKVSNGSERLICSSKELSEADVKIAQAYRLAASNSNDKDALKSAQNKWRTTERDACADVQCMLAAYQKRIGELAR